MAVCVNDEWSCSGKQDLSKCSTVSNWPANKQCCNRMTGKTVRRNELADSGKVPTIINDYLCSEDHVVTVADRYKPSYCPSMFDCGTTRCREYDEECRASGMSVDGGVPILLDAGLADAEPDAQVPTYSCVLIR